MKQSFFFGSIVFFVTIVLSVSCSKPNVPRQCDIKRLDRSLYAIACGDSNVILPDEGVELLEGYLSSKRGETTAIREYAVSKAVETFQPDVEMRFESLDSIELILSEWFGRMDDFLPEIGERRLYGVVNPFNNPVVVGDSAVLICLNHYLGSDYEGYSGFSAFQRKKKRPGRIPFDVVESLVVTSFPFNADNDPIMLKRMIYEGAVLYNLSRITGTDVFSILDYSECEKKWVLENEKEIWKTFARNYLFSTNSITISGLLNPSAGSYILSREAPSEIGRFIGYKIIEKYMYSHPGVKPSFLLSEQFYNSRNILVETRYNP